MAAKLTEMQKQRNEALQKEQSTVVAEKEKEFQREDELMKNSKTILTLTNELEEAAKKEQSLENKKKAQRLLNEYDQFLKNGTLSANGTVKA